MPGVPFEPSQAVRFHLAEGIVQIEGATAAVVPTDALAELCAAAGDEATAGFGRALGRQIGERVASRIALREATAETVAAQLAAELALAGLGRLALEQWGRALVLVVDDCPLGADGDALLAAAFEGALAPMSGGAAEVVVLERDATRVRFVVAGPIGAARVRDALACGTAWAEALVALHRGEGA